MPVRIGPLFTIASTPRWGREPCAACPVTSISSHTNPLWATASSISVGSVTIAASALRDSSASRTPMLACSSSATAATTTSPASPSAAASRHATSAAATPAFMSYAPRPCRRSPSMRGECGSSIPSTPTVSMCPQSSSVRPPPLPRLRTITLGRPSAASSHSDSSPASAAQSAMKARRRALPRAARHEAGVHRVDRHELLEQLHHLFRGHTLSPRSG